MSAKTIEEAFQRHPRPQLPTKAALLLGSLKPSEKSKTSASKQSEKLPLRHESPWSETSRLGEMTQGKNKLSLGLSNGKISMLKRMEIEAGKRHLEMVKLLHHSNIAKLESVFEQENHIYFQFEYSRFTLEEVLHVHLRFDESHIQAIAYLVSPFELAVRSLTVPLDLLCN